MGESDRSPHHTDPSRPPTTSEFRSAAQRTGSGRTRWSAERSNDLARRRPRGQACGLEEALEHQAAAGPLSANMVFHVS
jgi:hypothetical protein